MASPTEKQISFIFLLTLATSFSLTFASPPLYTVCSSSNFTSRSGYGANLNGLLSSLSSSTRPTPGFYNLSYGRSPSTAYALGLCRGDVSPQTCHRCISIATSDLSQGCPNREQGLILYDECMLRYSNGSIFGRMETSPGISFYNIKNVSNPGQFNQVVRNLLDSLRENATSGDPLRMFATGDVFSSNLPRVYALVQCTPDLNATSCNNCLNFIIQKLPQCCNGKQGGRSLCPSCNFRYEIERFYEGSDSAEAPTPAVVPAPPTSMGSDAVPPPAPSGTPAQPTGANNAPSTSSPTPASAANAIVEMSSGILGVFVALLVF